MSCDQSLSALRASLALLEQSRLSIDAFCRAWREQAGLLAALPPRYGQVMEDLLGRLEAGSLFTEESCSFSQQDLHASLKVWLEKAEHQLAAQAR